MKEYTVSGAVQFLYHGEYHRAIIGNIMLISQAEGKRKMVTAGNSNILNEDADYYDQVYDYRRS